MTAPNSCRATEPGAPGQPGATRARDAVVAAALFAASLTLLVVLFQTLSSQPWQLLDLRVYLWGGGLVRHAHDPYLYSFPHYGLHFTYTPEAAGFFALISLISEPVVKGLVTAASIISLLGVLWITAGALPGRRSRGRVGVTLAVAAAALWLEPLRQTLSFGQVNLLLMVLIVADLGLPGSRWWKGAGVGLAAGFKLTPLIFIPYLLLTRQFRAAAVATATFALTIAASVALLPKATEHYWFDRLFLNPHRLGNIAYVGNQSLYGALLRLTGSTAAAQPYRLAAVAVVGTGGLLLAAWASRRGLEMAGILVCALTGLLVSPVSWSHHWVWVAPMIVVLADLATRPLALAQARRWRVACWLGITAISVVFSGIIWAVPSAGGHRAPVQGHVMTPGQQFIGDLYVLTGLLGLGVTAAVLVLARRREQRVVTAVTTYQGASTGASSS
ncbi:MAG TPA: glycosyltransferase 87 family protein [Streptosporangiaceae bacterium]|nr:glycosyltransferase 87 family protein [Streptosporangiaceae bacterium]